MICIQSKDISYTIERFVPKIIFSIRLFYKGIINVIDISGRIKRTVDIYSFLRFYNSFISNYLVGGKIYFLFFFYFRNYRFRARINRIFIQIFDKRFGCFRSWETITRYSDFCLDFFQRIENMFSETSVDF